MGKSKVGISTEQQQQLDELGYTVIPDVLSETEIMVYRKRLLKLAKLEQEDKTANMHTENKGQLVRWLVNKGELFEKLVAHPKVVPYFEYMLGPDYILSTLTSNIISPEAKDGPYHIDNALGQMPEPLPSFPMFVNSLWLLNDFTPENGGTRFVPASHRRLKKPSPNLIYDPEEVRLTAKKGSVFLFNGAIWHAAGGNKTTEPRIALICFCCRSFIKQMFDFVHYLKPEVVDRATPEMYRIYGFDSQPMPTDTPKD
ncbi:hypothetical protein CMK22_13635 [Candidatus Poribacteria bacterium]|nr:hypothetical protein [Candidatus Poribacteria bacterium]